MSRYRMHFIILSTVAIVSISFIFSFRFLFPVKKDEPKFRCATCEKEMRDSISGNKQFSEGEKLFITNCASCHCFPNRAGCEDLSFHELMSRVPARDWIYGWIRNSDSVIKSGDTYANKLFELNAKARQPNFQNLTNSQIDQILKYLGAIK